jgi:hypothetical protein
MTFGDQSASEPDCGKWMPSCLVAAPAATARQETRPARGPVPPAAGSVVNRPVPVESHPTAAAPKCAHCQRGSLVVPDTLGTAIKLTSSASWRGRSLGANGLPPAGQVLSPMYRAGRCDVPRDPLAPGLLVSGPAPSRYSRPRAGRSATECERGRGLLALAGTPITRLGERRARRGAERADRPVRRR